MPQLTQSVSSLAQRRDERQIDEILACGVRARIFLIERLERHCCSRSPLPVVGSAFRLHCTGEGFAFASDGSLPLAVKRRRMSSIANGLDTDSRPESLARRVVLTPPTRLLAAPGGLLPQHARELCHEGTTHNQANEEHGGKASLFSRALAKHRRRQFETPLRHSGC